MRKYFFIIVLILPLFFISCEDILLGHDPDNTPVNNFNILWKEFDLYYPSFIVKNINWDSLYSIYRDSVTQQISEDRLWGIVSEILSNLNDPHVYMYNRDYTRFFDSRSSKGHYGEFSLDLVKMYYLKGNYKTAGEGNFIYGRFMGDSIGYIRVESFSGNNIWSHDIDNIVEELINVKAVILDIRENHGGIFDNCNYIASAFIDRPITYLIEKTRNGPGHSDFTLSMYHIVKPKDYAHRYTKRIILLTNKITVSAAEVFTLIFKQLSYSTQIGDSTAGGLGFSSRTFLLPNGWTYHMPQSLNLSVDGQSFEGVGILPDIYVKNSWKEIERGYDRILEYAIQYASR